MKYHKIKNVPLDICTAEQKIAYNLAFSHSLNFKTVYNNAPFQFQKQEIKYQAIQKMINFYKASYNYTPGKFDIDAIFCALNAGLENYFESNNPILSSYEAIGKMFPANYLN